MTAIRQIESAGTIYSLQHTVVLRLVCAVCLQCFPLKPVEIRTDLWSCCGFITIAVSMSYGRCRSDGKFREVFRTSSDVCAAIQRITMSKYSLMSSVCTQDVLGLQLSA